VRQTGGGNLKGTETDSPSRHAHVAA
jgi:hypothetical protein